MGKRLCLENYIILAKQRNGKCLSEEYINSRAKLFWECKYNHIWEARYDDIKNGKWCPFCAKKKKHTIEDCRQLATIKGGKCVSEKYINALTDLLWECSEGHQWWARYNAVQQISWCPSCAVDKRRQTFFKKYGVFNASQVPEIATKQSKTSNNCYILFHWKTNEEIICRGSYEKRVVEWLNKNKIDFDFQIPFDMPNKKRYFVDLFLKDQNLWVEIKGYKRPKNMEKWFWFHKEHPNSELWDEKKLKEMKLL